MSMNEVVNQETVNEQEVIICSCCGREIIAEEEIAVRTPVGEVYCVECCEVCEYCGEFILPGEEITANNTIRWLQNRTACPSCAMDNFEHCRDCGEYFTAEGIWDYYNDEPVCHYCEQNGSYLRCEECGLIMLDGDAFFDEERDAYFCEQHYHPRTHHMHGYGHLQVSPERSHEFLKLDGETGVKLHYGIELETDKGGNVDEYVDDLYDVSDSERLFHCKHDGSLDNGVEIVTQPMTFKYAMQKFPFAEIAEVARRHGFRSHDAQTCGLHIHVSRVGLGNTEYEQDLTTAKLMIMFDRFWAQMVKFSRRGNYEIDRWAARPGAWYSGIERKRDETIVSESKNRVLNAGRYQAINLQPRHTVEFRLFRGTLNVDTIIATIQFVQTVIDYAKHTPLKECIEADWMDFVRSDYKELNEYLHKRGLWYESEEPRTVRQDSGDEEDGIE